MSFDPRALRTAFGSFATGIAIVTARLGEDVVGITVNSLTSVSLDPALLLFCLKVESRHQAAFAVGHAFAVNILSDQQRALSDGYASSAHQTQLLPGMIDRPDAAPLVDQAISVFDCTVVQQVVAGDHLILIGQINHFTVSDTPAEPLLYVRGQYRHPGDAVPASHA